MSNKSHAAIVRPVAEETPLRKFERELQERNPNRAIVAFPMPSRVREARAVYIKEIGSRDDLEAAKMADSSMTDLEKSSQRLSAEAHRKEAIRISVVGLVTRTEPIQYVHIGGAVPFIAMNEWSHKAMTCLRVYFGQVNGVDDEELLEGLKGQRTIGGSVAPTNETPAAPSGEG